MPKYKREFVTPQVARGLMMQNADNQRSLKWAKIPGYVRDMIAGDWNEDTGETIKIDTNGRMIDGQNRVQAVIEAGDKLPEGGIWFDIAYGVPPEAMLVIDSGSARTAADSLDVMGVGNRNNVSSIVRWVIMWDAGNYTGRGGMTINPTHSEILKKFDSDAERFVGAVRRSLDLRRAKIGAFRPLGVAYYLFNRIEPVECGDFFDGLISGANLPERSPILALRNRLIRAQAERVTPVEQLVLAVRAWNHHRARTQIKGNLIISNDGKVNNAMFPQPK